MSASDPSLFVRDTRILLGLTQAQLSHAMGVTLQTVWAWENQQHQPSAMVLEWCKVVRQIHPYVEMLSFAGEPKGDWKSYLSAFGLGDLVTLVLAQLVGK